MSSKAKACLLFVVTLFLLPLAPKARDLLPLEVGTAGTGIQAASSE